LSRGSNPGEIYFSKSRNFFVGELFHLLKLSHRWSEAGLTGFADGGQLRFRAQILALKQPVTTKRRAEVSPPFCFNPPEF